MRRMVSPDLVLLERGLAARAVDASGLDLDPEAKARLEEDVADYARSVSTRNPYAPEDAAHFDGDFLELCHVALAGLVAPRLAVIASAATLRVQAQRRLAFHTFVAEGVDARRAAKLARRLAETLTKDIAVAQVEAWRALQNAAAAPESFATAILTTLDRGHETVCGDLETVPAGVSLEECVARVHKRAEARRAEARLDAAAQRAQNGTVRTTRNGHAAAAAPSLARSDGGGDDGPPTDDDQHCWGRLAAPPAPARRHYLLRLIVRLVQLIEPHPCARCGRGLSTEAVMGSVLFGRLLRLFYLLVARRRDRCPRAWCWCQRAGRSRRRGTRP